MTFITAIQLNDSIIVTADNKKVILKELCEVQFCTEQTTKIHAWEKGIITGTGESYVVSRSVELFKKIAQSDLSHLPDCLNISRHMRELEIGTEYDQVENTKLLCSRYNQQGAQLYKIERFDPSAPYTLIAIEPMNITVWMFNPNIETISKDLKRLHGDLKDYSEFSNKVDWANYYINRLVPIYQKQSLQDPLMSQGFDIFFQTKDEYLLGHIPNTQNSVLEFKEISSNIEPI